MSDETRKKRFQRVRDHFQANAVRAHFEEHREAYIAGAACLLAGAVGATTVVARKPDILAANKIIALLAWKPTQILEQHVIQIKRGRPGNPVRCVQTGSVFPSQGEAARSMGLSPGNLSQHLNGKYKHVGGYTFNRLEEAAEA